MISLNDIKNRITQKERFSMLNGMSPKIGMFMILIVILPMFMSNMLFIDSLHKGFKKQLNQYYENMADQYSSSIHYKLGIYQNLLDNVVANGTVQETLENQFVYNSGDRVDVSNRLSQEMNNLILVKNTNEIYNLTFYVLNREFPTDGRFTDYISTVEETSWFEKVKEGKENIFYLSSGGEKVVSIVRPIFSMKLEKRGEVIGYVRLDLMANRFFTANDSDKKFKNVVFIVFDKEKQLIFESKKGFFASITGEIIESKKTEDNPLKIIEANQKVIVYTISPNSQWRIGFVSDNSKMQDNVQEINKLTISVFIVLIFVFGLFLFIFTKTITNRIQKIIRKMKKVEDGSLEVMDSIAGNDEIAMIDVSFNRMIKRLGELIDQNYIKEIKRKEAELKTLQFQINPHFLYNTLEVINQIASVYKCSEIGTITQKLGEMFRYSINGHGVYVQLKDEIQHIQNYLEIQLVQSDKVFDVFYDIPPALLETKVLRFILQPLVENAINHGLRLKKENGCIEVIAKLCGDDLHIIIQDDGRGMSPEKVEWLMKFINEEEEEKDTSKKRSIGMKNVNSRIKMVYGSEYGLYIKSIENVGTLVGIRIPVIRGEDG